LYIFFIQLLICIFSIFQCSMKIHVFVPGFFCQPPLSYFEFE
jgi:hypothetical protein